MSLSRPEIIRRVLPRAKHWIEHGFRDPAEVEGGEEVRLTAFRDVGDEIHRWVKNYFWDPSREKYEGKVQSKSIIPSTRYFSGVQ